MASKRPDFRVCNTCKAVFTSVAASVAHAEHRYDTGICPAPPNHIAPAPLSCSEPSSSYSDEKGHVASDDDEQEHRSDTEEKGAHVWPPPVAKHGTGSTLLQMAQTRYVKVSLVSSDGEDVSAPAYDDDDVDVSHAEKPSKRPAAKKQQKKPKDVKPHMCPYMCHTKNGDLTRYAHKKSLVEHLKKKHATEPSAAAAPMVGFDSVHEEEDTAPPVFYADVDMMAPATLHDPMTSPNLKRPGSFSLTGQPSPKKQRLDESVPMHIRSLLDTVPSPSPLRQHLAQTMPALTFNKFLTEVIAVFTNPVASNYQPKDTVRVGWLALNEMIAKLKWFVDQLLVLSTLIETTVHNAFNGDPVMVGKLHMLTQELMPVMQNFTEWRASAAQYAHDAAQIMQTILGVLTTIGRTDMRLLTKSVAQFGAWQAMVSQTMDHLSLLMDVFHTGDFPGHNTKLVCKILARKDVKNIYETTKCARCTKSVARAYEKICAECTLNEAPELHVPVNVPGTEHDWYMQLAAGINAGH